MPKINLYWLQYKIAEAKLALVWRECVFYDLLAVRCHSDNGAHVEDVLAKGLAIYQRLQVLPWSEQRRALDLASDASRWPSPLPYYAALSKAISLVTMPEAKLASALGKVLRSRRGSYTQGRR